MYNKTTIAAPLLVALLLLVTLSAAAQESDPATVVQNWHDAVALRCPNIFNKLQVADRAQVIMKAREAGLGRE